MYPVFLASGGPGDEDRHMFGKAVTMTAALLASTPAWADIRIAVSYAKTEIEVLPVQTVRHSSNTVFFNLKGRSVEISHAVGARNSGELGRPRDRNALNGKERNSLLRVEAGNQLVDVASFPSFYIKTTIKTNRINACSAEIQTVLRPGHRYFEEILGPNREHAYFSDVHFDNVRCEISSR